MHLLFLGAMKWLVEQWLNFKLSSKEKKVFEKLLLVVEEAITSEFQRKSLDVNELSNWKATQYRLLLLYCSAFVLEHVLEKSMYQHFMLLFVLCRILFSAELAVKHADYAKRLLHDFFILLPSLYGTTSQKMNKHNLLHVADDVKTMEAPLSAISAFEFENCLGKLKSLIKSRKDIVPQRIKRLSEFEFCPQASENIKFAVNNIVKKKENIIIEKSKNSNTVEKIIFKDMIITNQKPNNMVILETNEVVKIKEIFENDNDIFMEAYNIQIIGDSFRYPVQSSKIGIVKLGEQDANMKFISLNKIKNKCLLLTVNEIRHAIPLLHVEE